MTKPIDNISSTAAIAIADRALFSAAVAAAAHVVERRNSIPILSNVMLTGHGGALTITGTDLDIEIQAKVACPADERLSITVPAKLLKDILAKGKASDLVSLEQTDSDESSRCAVDLGGVQFSLQTIPAIDFPNMEMVTGNCRFGIAAADLSAMFDRTKFAISTEETRYYLNGVYLHHEPQGNALRCVATDGHRLGKMEMSAPDGSEAMPGVIVPRKTVGTILDLLKVQAKALGKGAVPPAVVVEVTASKIRFHIGESVVVTSKLIDGTFPDYERVIPRMNDKRAVMNVKALDGAVDQVSLISLEKGRAVRFELSAGKMTLTVNNPDAGTATTTIETAGYDHDPMTIGFNASYLRAFAAEMGGDDIEFVFVDAGSPTVIRDPSDARWMGVLMPMRV